MRALSPRLKEVAALVRRTGRVADIGTDHAYLPVYLVEHGVCQGAIASDLRPGPLENARANVEAAGLNDKIELRLSDGLDKIKPDEADDIIIAGMGGILISDILGRTSWLKNTCKHLVLQPMTHAEYLRAFLATNGYEILRESVCEDTGKLYCIMSATFTARVVNLPEHYEYYGELPKSADPLAAAYLRRLADRLLREAGAMRCTDPARAQKLDTVAEKIENILSEKH